ncbi:unnamed protein product [Adineta ricciae]|uniref:Phospholipid scramblase n=1 Tax=Adineta ricciae TaxID=249248 RepID=A0A815MIQ5_ADIRI|nr:unnamed protein product [Adineta ricciae]CAF1565862.1 unnamed protein product [Adineta ricciae]
MLISTSRRDDSYCKLKNSIKHNLVPTAVDVAAVRVESPPGRVISTVEREAHACNTTCVIKDANDQCTLTIMRPCCICNGNYSCDCKNRFIFRKADRSSETEAIKKQYVGSVHITAANPFVFPLNFSMNLDVRMKALVLDTLFLLAVTSIKHF